MDLKELLGEELYNQIKDKLGDKKIGIINDGNWIPKSKFDEVNVEKKEFKDQVDGLNIELGKLKDLSKGNEGLQTQLQTLQTQIADKDKAMTQLRKSNAIKLAALQLGPKDINDILPHLKEESITLADDGTVGGLKEQLETLKTNKPYLFTEEPIKGTGGSKGNGGKGGAVGVTKEDFNKMTYNQRVELYEKEPEVYRKLKE